VVVLLAAVASLLFPGAGQAFVCRPKCAVVWGVAGFVPFLLALWSAPLFLLTVAVRVVAAIHAAVKVRRAGPVRPNLHLAGATAVGNVVLIGVFRLLVMETYIVQSSSMQPALDFEEINLVDKLTPRFTGYERGEIVVFTHPAGPAYIKRLIAIGGDTVEVRNGALRVNGIAVTTTVLGETTYRDFDEYSGAWSTRDAIAVRESYAGRSYVVLRRADGQSSKDFPALLETMPISCEVSAEGWPGEQRVYRQPAMTVAPDGHSCVVPAGTYFFMGDNRDNSADSRSWGVVPEGQVIGRLVGRVWGRDFGRLGRVE
jgi:signal peptidase I